jgi:hypothetical protein
MQPNFKAIMKTAACVAAILLGVTGSSPAQSVSLTASRQNTVLPDGNTVPMWGWTCASVTAPATCTALDGKAQLGGATWQPPLITVPTGSGISIALTNNLPVVNTSLVIIGQLPGGTLGQPVREAQPRNHPPQTTTTWVAAGPAPSGSFTPPAQGQRTRSFAAEAAPAGSQTYTWPALRPGTYLIETGTYPSIQGPMGLYGVLVVTTAPAAAVAPAPPVRGTAYPGVNYDADVPLLLSEIDPVQNASTDAAIQTTGFSEVANWTPACGSAHTCYPPAVDFNPLYYLINGKSFSKTAPTAFPVTAAVNTGNILLRFVNAGLRMHVPSVVGLNMALMAEDANVLPEISVALNAKPPKNPQPKTQNEVFLPAGKVYDVIVNPAVTAPAANTPSAFAPAVYAIFDRQLSLSANNQRDAGMQGYLQVAGGVLSAAAATANNDTYPLVPGVPLVISDPGKGVIANDVNVYGVQVKTAPAGGTLTLNPDGTFTYVPNAGTKSDSFVYYANGNQTLTATVTLSAATIEPASGITANPDRYNSTTASVLKINPPGVLSNDVDAAGYPLKAIFETAAGGLTVKLNPDGSFTATATTPGTYTFTYHAQNSQLTNSNSTTATVVFPASAGLKVTVQDAQTKAAIADYRWVIEEDRTFKIDPATQVNNGTLVPSLGTNFHTSHLPMVATGCTGPVSCESGQTIYDPVTKTHGPAVCDGHGLCVPDTSGNGQPQSTPDQVAACTATLTTGCLDPNKSYFISILPGDAANAFSNPNNPAGHTIGGSPIPSAVAAHLTTFAPVTVNLEPSPVPTSQVTVFVFEDDNELNGEHDAEQGVEPGLGGFNVELWDVAGATGDATGQMTYDMFNMPLTNALNGTIDPKTGLNACPLSPSDKIGVIVVCPEVESDGQTLSPLAGQAIIQNLMPGRFSVIVHPGAEREARGEEWLQTNTLDGTHFLDSFVRQGEPPFFQEFGPPGWHVFMGFVNPAKINKNKDAVCAGTQAITGPPGGPDQNPPAPAAGHPIPCNNTIKGQITNLHISRPPDERIFDSAVEPEGSAVNRAVLAHTQCYVSLGVLDSPDIALTKCDANGNFTFTNVPDGSFSVTVFDQWLDQLLFEKEITVANGQILDIGTYPVFTWQTHAWNSVYLDLNQNGIRDPGEPGIGQIPVRNRYRDGSFSNTLFTDINGNANFNEVFPLFNWYVIESDTTRFKGTGVHVAYDAGGALDASGTTYAGIINSKEQFPVPANLRVPGAVYCAKADCSDVNLASNPSGGGPGGSTGRIDPGTVTTEGWQGYIGQTEFLDWGKARYDVGETGGIVGHVIYSSTRPFDDPGQLFQNLWEPLVPGVTINLYQELVAADGTQSLKLVDTTATSSWDDWAQGFNATTGLPNMSCPGQDPADPFFNFTLNNSVNFLSPNTALPNHAQFKCYDGMHSFNQVLPAPYDGRYQFPSALCSTPGATFTSSAGQSITCATVANPANTNAVANPNHIPFAPAVLPAGKYVVEVVVPPGFEIVKEEDKNILIGDAFIAPVTQQFGNIVNIFIVADQASLNAFNPSYTGPVTGVFNPTTQNNGNPTTNFGRNSIGGFGPGGLIVMPAPCVGTMRIVPDFMSIFPQAGEVAPFAGASRPLCDRKEITLEDQMQGQTDFFIFTQNPISSHYTGFILDDFSSEFDPNSPDFGEKFAVPNVPVSIKDFNGQEITRVYSDQWGMYNGVIYSTWQVNPPNPTGYAPNVMITCMNDPGPIPDPAHPGQFITDPLFNPLYSNFCYENPFMPGRTTYLDTPVIPIAAFADAYNSPDCAYPDTTPAIKTVTGDSSGGGAGPWVSAPGHQLTITALGDQVVPNYAYSGPAATIAPYNQKFITRHYGFGSSAGSVTVGGIPLTGVSWSDTVITGSVPADIPACAHQQAGHHARCGELVITAANGKRSIDTVTVTVGGKAPTYINGENGSSNAIQSALDSATPGDLIIVGPGNYNEMLIMWKPVRLQGVGAASVTINGNAHPAGKLTTWRTKIDCLFGLGTNGFFIGSNGNPPPPGCVNGVDQNAADILPDENITGWDITLNGNLGESAFGEPTLMGALEGAVITVVGKGVRADGVTHLTDSHADCLFPGNFLCAPSRIDGLGLTNSSAGGGGIFAHGWNHNLEIANNRIFSNGGTLTGGIIAGQIELEPTGANGTPGPYLYNINLNVHHNAVTNNASMGDEFNTDTPAAGGGVTFCTGTDYYHFNYNWICGNLSTGDGGGVSHFGLSWNGDISHNWILFNQSNNTTLTTHGGGITVEGDPQPGNCEGLPVDLGCATKLTDGTGNVSVDANLIQGNFAESGTGGGLRLQKVNGTDVIRNPNSPGLWWKVSVTNNMIIDNVAGWAGGGISIFDAANSSIVNNTIMNNDAVATAGVLFDTVGNLAGSTPPPPPTGNCAPSGQCEANNPVTTSTYQVAGVVSELHGPELAGIFGTSVTCPPGQPNCTKFSSPQFDNNIIWHNRSFHITVGANPIPGLQNVVTLVPQLSQTTTGQCPATGFGGGAGPTYWDIGVIGDDPNTRAAGSNTQGVALFPQYTIMTSTTGYTGSGLSTSDPQVVSQYCNGSRIPPEIAAAICANNANAPGCSSGGNGGVGVPPGIPDIDPFYPLFTLNPSATVDEGNNFINVRYGPLSLSNASTFTAPNTNMTALGDGHITAASPARDAIPLAVGKLTAPGEDFDSRERPQGTGYDIGAHEFPASLNAVAGVLPAALAFNNQLVLTRGAAQTVTLTNIGSAPLTLGSITITGLNAPAFERPAGAAGGTCVTGRRVAVDASCTINVFFRPMAVGSKTATLTINVPNQPLSAGTPKVSLTGEGTAPIASLGSLAPSPVVSTRGCTTACASGTVTLSNTGTAPLSITRITIEGPHGGAFSPVTSNCGSNLASGATCAITVRFHPRSAAAAGARTATLTVHDNSHGSATKQSTALAGTAK